MRKKNKLYIGLKYSLQKACRKYSIEWVTFGGKMGYSKSGNIKACAKLTDHIITHPTRHSKQNTQKYK